MSAAGSLLVVVGALCLAVNVAAGAWPLVVIAVVAILLPLWKERDW